MKKRRQHKGVYPPALQTGWRVAFMGSTYSQFDPFGQSLLVSLPFPDDTQTKQEDME